MTFTFSGPDTDLYWAVGGGMVIGAAYSSVANISKTPAMFIFAIRELADWIFYHLAVASLNQPTDRTCAGIYAVTNLTVNIYTLCVLRQMNLIGAIGTRIFLGIMVLEMICKVADFSKYRVDVIEA